MIVQDDTNAGELVKQLKQKYTANQTPVTQA